VPTLWDAATKAGRTTASIQWPVTVGAHINWVIPEFWRANTPDDAKLLRAVSTPGLIAEASAEIGPYSGGVDSTVEADKNRGKYAEWILEKKHPTLLTLHLIALDHIEHETGPFSPEAVTVLEGIDAAIGGVWEAAERLVPGHVFIAVVSDHGFARTDAQLNLFAAFREAKLFDVDVKGKITDWKAMPWVTGGSDAIVLKDPTDEAVRSQVKDLLTKTAADPANGVDRVLDADELHERGDADTPLLTKTKAGGTHGELPDVPDLRASFFLVGPGVPAAKDLGVIDMRNIAPTLAHEVGLELPSADGKNMLP
jgi:predicted AlkP superfamily pyrophosphatase or phosphodiesterase